MRVGTTLTRAGMIYGKKPEYPVVCCRDEWQAGYGGGHPHYGFFHGRFPAGFFTRYREDFHEV
jgi:hypothetical protein